MIDKFITLFTGLDRAYGKYVMSAPEMQGMKVVGKPATIHEKVTRELWEDHIAGVCGLGIVPIRDGNTCYFGAIDIDKYDDMDTNRVLNEAKNADMPIVFCRSKSGGLHGFCFVSEPVAASDMRNKLRMMASFLGYGETEIFPKQVAILTDRRDVGGWINMPYFDAGATDRYAYGDSSEKKLSADEFIELAFSKRWGKKAFLAYSVPIIKQLDDGPPCLQSILSTGMREGFRNDTLSNLAVYLRKAYPETWQMELGAYNDRYCTPPVSAQELENIKKSHLRTEYFYGCKRPPLKSHCDKEECRRRAYGLHTLSGDYLLKDLAKYDSQPPIWFVNVGEIGRVELSTEDLQQQNRFQRRCMEALSIMPNTMKTQDWQEVVRNLMGDVTIIDAAPDASPKGIMFEHLAEFCTGTRQGRTEDSLLAGLVYTNAEFHIFRLIDFLGYLAKKNFRDFKSQQIGSLLNDNGGEDVRLTVKGRVVRAWKFPKFASQNQEFEIPEIMDTGIL